MKDLFGDKPEIIRTLGFYQPFCSLMLHGKVETRWIKEGMKPPFPKGKYLFYSTKKACETFQLFEWCGTGIVSTIDWLLMRDETRKLNGYAIAVGELVNLRHMTAEDVGKTFVQFKGTEIRQDKDGNNILYRQWCLEFINVTAIQPIEFKFGKQGVGILPESEYGKIKYLTPVA